MSLQRPDKFRDVLWREAMGDDRLTSQLRHEIVAGADQHFAEARREPVVSHETKHWAHGTHR